MVAPNRNFIYQSSSYINKFRYKNDKVFSTIGLKTIHIHKYITCRLCKGTVAGKVGFHYEQNVFNTDNNKECRVVSGHLFGSSSVSLACITLMCSVQRFPGSHSLCLAFESFF